MKRGGALTRWPHGHVSLFPGSPCGFSLRSRPLAVCPLPARPPAVASPCPLPPWDAVTSLDGFLSTSPTPPPLRSPWLSTVTMHISSVSHVCSLSCSISSAGSSSANTVSSGRLKREGIEVFRRQPPKAPPHWLTLRDKERIKCHTVSFNKPKLSGQLCFHHRPLLISPALAERPFP